MKYIFVYTTGKEERQSLGEMDAGWNQAPHSLSIVAVLSGLDTISEGEEEREKDRTPVS